MARKRGKKQTGAARKRPGGKSGKRQLADKTITPWEAQVWENTRKGRRP